MDRWWLYCVVVIVLSAGDQGQACSEPEGYKLQPLNERAKEADIIVFAEAIRDFPSTNPHLPNIVTTEFRLICHIKNKDEFARAAELGPVLTTEDKLLFNVSGMGHADGLCLSIEATAGTRYFLFLRISEETIHETNETRIQLVPDSINLQSPVIDYSVKNRNSLEDIDQTCRPEDFEVGPPSSIVDRSRETRDKGETIINNDVTTRASRATPQKSTSTKNSRSMSEKEEYKDHLGILQDSLVGEDNNTISATTPSSSPVSTRISVYFVLVCSFCVIGHWFYNL